MKATFLGNLSHPFISFYLLGNVTHCGTMLPMSEIEDIFLAKAQESLAGAQSELVNQRYNNCANRGYYACFQAAVAALGRAGIQPRSAHRGWEHDFVQAQFVGQLINRLHLYPTDLRGTLLHTMNLRHDADYGRGLVNQTEATRGVRQARLFVQAILMGEGDRT